MKKRIEEFKNTVIKDEKEVFLREGFLMGLCHLLTKAGKRLALDIDTLLVDEQGKKIYIETLKQVCKAKNIIAMMLVLEVRVTPVDGSKTIEDCIMFHFETKSLKESILYEIKENKDKVVSLKRMLKSEHAGGNFTNILFDEKPKNEPKKKLIKRTLLTEKEKFSNVNKHTRAGNNGRVIICPECKTEVRVYHFSWCAITCCDGCGEMIDKQNWIVKN